MKSLPFLLFTAALCITGCASVPKASPEYQQRAMSFAPASGKAGVYVIRPSSPVAVALLYQVSLDYVPYGTLASGSFTYAEVEPGQHMLQAVVMRHSAGEGKPFTFTAEPSKLYFLQTAMGFGYMKLEPVEEAKGKALVQKYKLSGDSSFGAQTKK